MAKFNFEGNRETKTILGNREYRKQLFDFGGTGEQANLFQWNKGTDSPTPWEGLNIMVHICQEIHNRKGRDKGYFWFTCLNFDSFFFVFFLKILAS